MGLCVEIQALDGAERIRIGTWGAAGVRRWIEPRDSAQEKSAHGDLRSGQG